MSERRVNENEDFEAYRAALLARHERALTAALSTLGDAVMVGALAVGVVSRRRGPVAALLALGAAITAAAHVFQPGTLRPELGAVLRHPWWAVRAETHRVLGHPRADGHPPVDGHGLRRLR